GRARTAVGSVWRGGGRGCGGVAPARDTRLGRVAGRAGGRGRGDGARGAVDLRGPDRAGGGHEGGGAQALRRRLAGGAALLPASTRRRRCASSGCTGSWTCTTRGGCWRASTGAWRVAPRWKP